MMFKTVLGVAAAATLAGALAPTMASAQAYGGYGGYGQGGAYASGGAYDDHGYYYDPCRRSTTQRGTGGGLLGAGIGAAIGNGMAAKGVRTEGTVLGGLLGAIAGTAIGRNSAACAPVPPRLPRPRPTTGAPITAYDNVHMTTATIASAAMTAATTAAMRPRGATPTNPRLRRERQQGRHRRLHPGRKPDLPARRPHSEALRPRLPGRLGPLPGRRLGDSGFSFEPS
jgi:hypothetical protein